MHNTNDAKGLLVAAAEDEAYDRRARKFGADCSKTDAIGWCPMIHAAFNGHVGVVKWLFHKGGTRTRLIQYQINLKRNKVQ